SGKTAAPSGTWASSSSRSSCSSDMVSTSGDGGDDAQLVAALDSGAQVVEVADVLVVEEDVEESLELGAVEHAPADVGVLLAEGVERGLDAVARDLDDGVAAGVLAHRRGDMDLDRHENSKDDLPQRHRDTEKTRRINAFIFCSSLCLCASVVPFFLKPT